MIGNMQEDLKELAKDWEDDRVSKWTWPSSTDISTQKATTSSQNNYQKVKTV